MASADRPLWVYPIFLAYALLAVAITLGPLAVAVVAEGELGASLTALVYAVVIGACGASLLVIPVGRSITPPDRQRSIWFPLIRSGLLAALLFLGLGAAAIELVELDQALPALVVAFVPVWVAWVLLFWRMSKRADRDRLNDRLYQSLVAGSVLELLVAILSHLVVRRRSECCAGMLTGFGIGVGVIVMVVALGPAVWYLFHRRYRQSYARKPKADG